MMSRVSLDIEDTQVLVHYESDRVPYHHRILVRRLEGSRWIWITPDYDVQVVDVSSVDLYSMGRAERFPDDCRPAYSFARPVDEAELGRARLEAKRVADIMGPPPPPAQLTSGSESRWLYADVASEQFGEPIEEAALLPGSELVVKSSMGLWRSVDGDDESCEFVERVGRKDEVEWKVEKRAGPGRDPRLASFPESSTGVVVLREQLGKFKEVEVAKWPFKGPRAITELL